MMEILKPFAHIFLKIQRFSTKMGMEGISWLSPLLKTMFQ
ncbi:hypothetical protein Sinac_1521 [Singulisphaera acidiphila DSM 18658]|uniref:Uncharacterized protein n=1 Tax=Singulisphaera acidiphila (strain ATCC BAA-1392 / DSM 18658 / VKM B-2454 / MOB10) TaxID=886293 RepID=L0DAM7_SINAD|nr:hypothetical protein Sinac_1521 [Singulisphaera acidiphila DSM 18658]